MAEPGKTWRIAHRMLSLGLTVVWVGAGATKLAGMSAFRGVLETHDVLPYAVIQQAWVLPVVEVLTGAAIFVGAGRPPRLGLLRTGVFASCLLLAGFCVYISRVDPVVFQTAGCGCAGAWGLTDLIGSPTRLGVAAVDVALTTCSLSLLWTPRRFEKSAAQQNREA